jgi:environmental stress-induced protein Ves
MKLILFADLTPKPWKNGGGTTTEIAVSPEGAGFDDFDWRLSVADVASDGPFSLFPRIDRTLTLIEGKGLAMQIDGRAPVTLTTASAPLAFPGDVPVSATLIDGAIRDFNVMTRRGRYSHKVGKHDLRTGPATLPPGDLRLIVSLGAGRISLGSNSVDADFGDVIAIVEDLSDRVTGTHAVLFVTLARSA